MNRNRTEIAGRLTRDPELLYTPKGTAVAEIGVAVNEREKDQSGEWQETTLFLDVTCWGKTAENVNTYLKKGDPIFIDGKLRLDQWVDKKTETKRQKLKIVALSIQFLGAKPKAGERRASEPAQHHRGTQDPQVPDQDDCDDIPF